jgi:hypothetical protein
MGIFGKPQAKPTVVKAQAASSGVGRAMIDNFTTYQQGEYRSRAMSVPVVARGRDLICGTIGNLKLEAYRSMWNGEFMERVPQAPRSWLARIDKGVPNSVILSWTADDLLFYGRAFWYVTERHADGYPMHYTRMPAAMVNTSDQAGPVWFGPSKQIYFNGAYVDWRDVVQFISPNQGLIYTTPKAIETAIKLEQARFRNAMSSIPSVVLKQTGGEPMSGQELADIAAAFDVARMNNQTAAVNEFIDVKETYATPDKMLLIEAADYQARDLCRSLGIPPYLAGIATGSYSYTNSQSARQDLYVFGMAPLISCIEETLSSDNVLPHNTGVRFNIDDYLSTVYGNEIIEPIPGAPAVEENTQERRA